MAERPDYGSSMLTKTRELRMRQVPVMKASDGASGAVETQLGLGVRRKKPFRNSSHIGLLSAAKSMPTSPASAVISKGMPGAGGGGNI